MDWKKWREDDDFLLDLYFFSRQRKRSVIEKSEFSISRYEGKGKGRNWLVLNRRGEEFDSFAVNLGSLILFSNFTKKFSKHEATRTNKRGWKKLFEP